MRDENNPEGGLRPESSSTKVCTGCGVHNPYAAKFCSECGATQASEPVEAVAPPVQSEEPSIKPEVIALSPDDEGLHPSLSPESAAVKPIPKSGRIPIPLFALGGLIAVVILIMIVRGSKSPQLNQSATASSPQSATPPSRILTKDPEFMKLLHPSKGDDLLEQSEAYKAKKNEIELKLASIEDPDLKKRLGDEEWGKVNVEDYKHQAEIAQLDATSSNLRAVLEAHRGDWFEVGHLSFTSTNTLQVSSVEASPISLPNGASISVDIASMDAVYARFRELASVQIEQKGRDWVNEQSCQARLRNVCRNLGGSQSECSDPAKLSEISETLGASGINGDCNDNASLEEGARLAETQMRSDRIVLVGQGDLISQRIDKLLIVDYDTETVLHEFSPDVLKADMSWKYPDEKNKGQSSSGSYKTETDTSSEQDFGIVPIHGNGSAFKKQITFNNESTSESPIAISLQGDPDNSFELDNDCSSGTVSPGDHCTVSVSFRPSGLGVHTAALSVEGQWHSLNLRGFAAWPWDIYRGETASIPAPATPAQPATPTVRDYGIRDAVAAGVRESAVGTAEAADDIGCPNGSTNPAAKFDAATNSVRFPMACMIDGKFVSLPPASSSCPSGWATESKGHGFDWCYKAASSGAR